MSAVTLKNVWKAYGRDVVLERVNLHVKTGEFVTVVGASGCGKTTFLRMLLGEESPTRGELLMDGRPMPGEPGPDRGVVFQKYSVFPHLNALNNVLVAEEFGRARLTGHLFGAARRSGPGKGHRDARGGRPAAGPEEIPARTLGRYAAASRDRAGPDEGSGSCCWTNPSVRWIRGSARTCTR